MTRELRDFFALASVDELERFERIGGTVPQEVWAEKRREAIGMERHLEVWAEKRREAIGMERHLVCPAFTRRVTTPAEAVNRDPAMNAKPTEAPVRRSVRPPQMVPAKVLAWPIETADRKEVYRSIAHASAVLGVRKIALYTAILTGSPLAGKRWRWAAKAGRAA